MQIFALNSNSLKSAVKSKNLDGGEQYTTASSPCFLALFSLLYQYAYHCAMSLKRLYDSFTVSSGKFSLKYLFLLAGGKHRCFEIQGLPAEIWEILQVFKYVPVCWGKCYNSVNSLKNISSEFQKEGPCMVTPGCTLLPAAHPQGH